MLESSRPLAMRFDESAGKLLLFYADGAIRQTYHGQPVNRKAPWLIQLGIGLGGAKLSNSGTVEWLSPDELQRERVELFRSLGSYSSVDPGARLILEKWQFWLEGGKKTHTQQ